MGSKGFGGVDTISTIGDQNRTNPEEDEASIEMLLLRIIFTTMKGTPAQLRELQQCNMSILDRYWDKNEDPVDEQEFSNKYYLEMQLMTEDTASNLWCALDMDFQKTVQAALNVLFERLRHTNTKMSPELLQKVKEIKLDAFGQASEQSLKQVFAAIHFKDKDLFNKFCGIYEEATG